MAEFSNKDYLEFSNKDYLDEDDLSLLHELKSLERPHQSTDPDPSNPNQFAAWDTPLWRQEGVSGRWDALKARLCEAVEELKRPINMDDMEKGREVSGVQGAKRGS